MESIKIMQEQDLITGVNDIGDKLSPLTATPAINDTSGKHKVSNISANLLTNSKWPQ
jgi:hypothetical protein